MNDNIMGGGQALSAGIGGFIGSAFGNNGFGGWGGNWNRGGCNPCMENAILDSVNGVANAVNNLNTSNLQGQCQIQAGADRNAAQILNSNAQGFSGVNTAVVQQGYESRIQTQGATAQILERLSAMQAQQAQCCCDTKQLIQQEGCATRALINDVYTRQLQDMLCQERAKNAQLQNQKDLAEQTAFFVARYPVSSSTSSSSS